MTDVGLVLRWLVLPGAIGAILTFGTLWAIAKIVWWISDRIDDCVWRPR